MGGGEEVAEVELEGTPLSVELARVELAENAGGGLRGLAGMKLRVRRPLEGRLRLEAGIERLDDPFHVQEAALGDSGDVQALVRELAARQVHPGDLEERDVLRAGVEVAAGGFDEARDEARAERGQLDRDRLGELPRRLVVGAQARRVDLGEAEPGERVLDAAAELLVAGEQAVHLAARGERERDVLEPEAGDLLDHVHLAGDVACPPGRDDDLAALSPVEAEVVEDRVLALGRGRDADQRVGALGAEGDLGPLRQVALDVALGGPLARR